ncbi:MAG: hypothetical protein IKD77_04875 [Bacilli bacterium]|nr:hypothetical protein [Bacilli bacterium]
MFKLYNTQVEISRDSTKYFKKVFPTVTKPQLKLIAPIILGMIESESVVTTDIEPYFSMSKYFDSVQITSNKFQTKLAVSKTNTHNEPFFILTNGNTREAVKHYGYRFGSIELYEDFFAI